MIKKHRKHLKQMGMVSQGFLGIFCQGYREGIESKKSISQ